MIEVSNLEVAIGGRTILHSIAFEARQGEVTAIIGPNGSGKTTLLKAISGEMRYTGGVSLNGREVSSMRPAEQAQMRAVLPQSTALSFPFTVREIVGLGIIGPASDQAARSGLIGKALAAVDLAGFAGRFYQELSGGEQQRVQFARALCQVWSPRNHAGSRFLLLDEPVSSLDIKHQLAIMNTARLFATGGGGVVAILHDLNLAAIFADRILAMADGEAIAFGPPREVIRDDVIREAFGCPLVVGRVPDGTVPFVLPHSTS